MTYLRSWFSTFQIIEMNINKSQKTLIDDAEEIMNIALEKFSANKGYRSIHIKSNLNRANTFGKQDCDFSDKFIIAYLTHKYVNYKIYNSVDLNGNKTMCVYKI